MGKNLIIKGADFNESAIGPLYIPITYFGRVLRVEDNPHNITDLIRETETRIVIGIKVPKNKSYVSITILENYECSGFIQINQELNNITDYNGSIVISSDSNWDWHPGPCTYVSDILNSRCQMVLINLAKHYESFTIDEYDNVFKYIVKSIQFK